MGCLCSSDRNSLSKIPARSASFNSNCSTDVNLGSFTLSKLEKNFYADYKLGKDVIGYGTHGEVRLCEHKITEQSCAVKIINKASLPSEVIKGRLIKKQFDLLSRLSHPSILKLHDFYEDNSVYFILMDFIKGGDLYNKLKSVSYFTEIAAARIMKQLLSAIAHMHSKKIAHRDIKPENIMLEATGSEIAVKIIDFDTAIDFSGKTFKEKQGSLYYMAPEVIKGDYNEKCDLWSAGVTMFVMLTNCFPFADEDEDRAETEKRILEGSLNVEFLKNEGISQDAIHLLTHLIHPDPSQRFSAADASHHGWILKYSYEPLPTPIFHKPYNVLSHALRLWAARFVIPSSELTHYHIAFIQTDSNNDGFLSKSEISRSLSDISDIETDLLFSDGHWTHPDKLDFFEFVALMASKEFWVKQTERISSEIHWNKSGEINTSELVWFLKSKLEGEDRFCEGNMPCVLSKHDFINILAN